MSIRDRAPVRQKQSFLVLAHRLRELDSQDGEHPWIPHGYDRGGVQALAVYRTFELELFLFEAGNVDIPRRENGERLIALFVCAPSETSALGAFSFARISADDDGIARSQIKSYETNRP
jgi:hypothetical protein